MNAVLPASSGEPAVWQALLFVAVYHFVFRVKEAEQVLAGHFRPDDQGQVG